MDTTRTPPRPLNDPAGQIARAETIQLREANLRFKKWLNTCRRKARRESRTRYWNTYRTQRLAKDPNARIPKHPPKQQPSKNYDPKKIQQDDDDDDFVIPPPSPLPSPPPPPPLLLPPLPNSIPSSSTTTPTTTTVTVTRTDPTQKVYIIIDWLKKESWESRVSLESLERVSRVSRVLSSSL